MLGQYSEFALTYLWVLGSITTVTFALPLFFVPLTWAKLMMWRVPEDTDLAEYFGRCVGAFVLVVEFFILKGAYTEGGLQFTFDMLAVVFTLMLVVHIYGAIRRIQPITETLEIGLWAFLLFVTYICYPVSSGI
ncbi:hypothetical protein ACMXYW_10955 [Neptuniibacter sp. QD48_55]|uniref:hypothetical protein n=1 Tax=Neptuniibacter sp. QD48_55 TaxID=3398212 RepID=UPI0039F455D6